MAQLPPVVLDPLPLPSVRDGLFQAAYGPLDLPAHVRTAGAVWETDLDGVGHLQPVACQAPPYPAITQDGPSGMVRAYAFDVYATETMPPIGHSASEAARRVRARLTMHEQQAVELALWGGGEGVTGVLQQLADAGSVIDAGTAADVVEAVSLLEQAGAAYPANLLIHARPRIGAYLAARGVVRVTPDSKPNETHFGSRYVLGDGYAGVGPAGEAVDATTEYMVATGRVIIWRDPQVWVSPPDQVLSTTTNQRGMIARRTYAVAVEGFAASVKVTRA